MGLVSIVIVCLINMKTKPRNHVALALAKSGKTTTVHDVNHKTKRRKQKIKDKKRWIYESDKDNN